MVRSISGPTDDAGHGSRVFEREMTLSGQKADAQKSEVVILTVRFLIFSLLARVSAFASLDGGRKVTGC